MLKQELLNIIDKYSSFNESERNDRILENIQIEPETVNMTVHALLYSSKRTANLTFDNIRVVIIYNNIKVSLNNTKNIYASVSFETLDELKKFVEEVL